MFFVTKKCRIYADRGVSQTPIKRKEKKELQKKIDETQKRLDSVVSSQQIQSDFQPRIDKINREKLAAIDKAVKEIRAKYKMPKYEDFAEV